MEGRKKGDVKAEDGGNCVRMAQKKDLRDEEQRIIGGKKERRKKTESEKEKEIKEREKESMRRRQEGTKAKKCKSEVRKECMQRSLTL